MTVRELIQTLLNNRFLDEEVYLKVSDKNGIYPIYDVANDCGTLVISDTAYPNDDFWHTYRNITD